MEVDIIVFLGLIALLILIALTLFGLSVYSGLNYLPTVSTGPSPLPQCRIAYKFIKGPYGGNLVGSTFTEVTSIAPKAQIIGIFYDNPQEVAEEKLRCCVGCVISAEGREPLSEEGVELLRSKGFAEMDLPGIGSAVLSSFPYTTPLSLRLAPLRVYPRLSEFIQEKDLCAYPMIELYEDAAIRYLAPLSQQDSFLVPEAAADQSSDSEPEDLASDADQLNQDGTDDEQSQTSATESDFEQIETPLAAE